MNKKIEVVFCFKTPFLKMILIKMILVKKSSKHFFILENDIK